jgi:uncharacterized protein YhdP
MKRSEKVTLGCCIAVVLLVICALWARAEGVPQLTDSQKLSISRAQVEFLLAQKAAESTPQYLAMVAAQSKLNDAVQKALKDAGIDQNKFQLQGDLSLIELRPSAPTPPKPEKK